MKEETQHTGTHQQQLQQQQQQQLALLVLLHGGILRQARVSPLATAVVVVVDVNKQVGRV